MVETLVFEAPTPLPEHSEREFSFPDGGGGPNGANDDSGIELQEEWVYYMWRLVGLRKEAQG